jgi:hypothetical protein
MEYERLIRPEHLSRGDAEQKRVTNLPGSAVTATLIGVFMTQLATNTLLSKARSRDRLSRLSMYPTKLNKIINLFESLPEDERRETLVSYADNAKKQEPREGENLILSMCAKTRNARTRSAFICTWMKTARRTSA